MTTNVRNLITGSLLLMYLEVGHAQTFTPLGTAIADSLGTKKASQKKITFEGKEVQAFTANGKVAIIQKAVFEPNCTHTWVIGLDGKTRKVEKITVVEMSCPHAFPAKADSWLDQYKGKGPGDLASLKSSVSTIAKATATCNMTTDAVATAVKAAGSIRDTASEK